MLAAEAAILIKLELLGGVLLVLDCVIVALFALRAAQGNLNPHFGVPP
jgi:hypothetical protein